MIKCPYCGAESHNPNDEREGYCGRCHWWTSDPVLGSAGVMKVVIEDEIITPLDQVFDK